MHIWFALALVSTLAGCATPPPRQVWLRMDGQRIVDNPILTQQAEVDRTICVGDTQRVNLSSLTPTETTKYSYGLNSNVELQRSVARMDSLKGCMAQKGYMLVPEDQAEAQRAQFEAVAAAKLAQAAPPPTTTGKKSR